MILDIRYHCGRLGHRMVPNLPTTPKCGGPHPRADKECVAKTPYVVRLWEQKMTPQSPPPPPPTDVKHQSRSRTGASRSRPKKEDSGKLSFRRAAQGTSRQGSTTSPTPKTNAHSHMREQKLTEEVQSPKQHNSYPPSVMSSEAPPPTKKRVLQVRSEGHKHRRKS
ncbi:hypothetical protein MTO96_000638 [Rhipicephalus appendiculatus]